MDMRGLVDRLEHDGVQHLWVIYHDYSGRACGKTIPRERFRTAVDRGVVFARANLDFTLEDHQAPDARLLADSGDFLAVPDPESYAPVPYHEGTARVFAFMRNEDRSEWEGCPRTALTRAVEAYAARGLSIRVGFEPEFYLLARDDSGEYRPADRDGMFTVAGLARHNDLWRRTTEILQAMGVSVEQLGKEYGPGQYEATPHYAPPIAAVDDYLTLKEVVRAVAREAGLLASFMPKPFADLAGSGLHLHLSLWDEMGARELSAGESGGEPLSTLGRQFLAGILAHAGGLTGLGSPIANSYKRLIPGSWAPAHVSWAVGNRAVLVRVPGLRGRQHLELRSPDNAANPFILLTAVLAAGLDGIERQLEPPPPVQGDIGHLPVEELRAQGVQLLPRSLSGALQAFEKDPVLTGALGPAIAGGFLRVKRAEMHAYEAEVHPWERRTYLEAI